MSRTAPTRCRLAWHLTLVWTLLPAGRALPLHAQAAADLRLEWLSDGHPTPQPGPVAGRSGDRVEVRYRLTNTGDREAFAAVIHGFTALGPLGPAERIEPGPRPGQRTDRSRTVVLAAGMRELCLEVRLQNRTAGDPPDPRPQDNRICRRVQVQEPQATKPGPFAHRAAIQRRTLDATPFQ